MIGSYSLILALTPTTSRRMLNSISTGFSTGSGSAETWIMLGGLAVVVLLAVVAARFFGRHHSAAAEPRTDYLTLAVDLLGLSESDRRVLVKVAHHARPDRPAAMLLSPGNLADAASPLLTESDDPQLRQHIDDICQRLFDSPLPSDEPDAASTSL